MSRLSFQIIAVHLAALFIAMIGATALWAQEAGAGGGTLLFNNEQNCGPTPLVAQRLLDRYEEIQVAQLDMTDQSYMALFVNHIKETWTLVEVNANGLTCVRSWGNGLHLALGEPT
jgi:hypothetical protein